MFLLTFATIGYFIIASILILLIMGVIYTYLNASKETISSIGMALIWLSVLGFIAIVKL